MKIAILERNSVGLDIDVTRYEDFGEVTVYANTVTEEEVAQRVADADIIIANKAPLNERSLKDAKNVKLITNFATGYDSVDIEYCKKRGITFCNIRDYATEMVAQHTFALALYVMEHLSYYDEYVKSGAYAAQDRFSHFDQTFTEIAGKTWGIAGMGNIGKRVARIAEAFGAKVITFSTSGKPVTTETAPAGGTDPASGEAKDYPRVDFDTFLKESDIISVHCPLTDRTRDLFDTEAFSKMKQTAVIVNVARGPVINEEALAKALKENKIAGAGLDVLTKEPIRKDSPLYDFKDSKRLLITPHMAWASVEARERCCQQVYENIDGFLKGKPVRVVV